MDLLSSKTMEVTNLALNGLLERQRAIGANIANVNTPGYQRKEVAFESQLSEIIEKEELKKYIKGQNSIKPEPVTNNEFFGIQNTNPITKSLTLQESNFLQSNSYDKFGVQTLDDIYSEGTLDGNNVQLEREMTDLTKAGTKYVLLSNLQRKSYSGLTDVIKGGAQ